jgi:DNA-binding transcriptional ArsR family regulator
MLMDMDGQTENAVFRALADPTRRALLSMLGEQAQPVSALTDRFDMSQPAISQHLKVLREAGLVTEHKAGRNRIYALDPEPLRHAALWLERHTDFWATRLDNLGRHLREKHGKDA